MIATVHAVVQATPSLTPSVTPVAVAAHAAATTGGESLTDLLNKLANLVAPYVVVIGGFLAVLVQALLNRFPWLSHEVAAVQDLYRRLVAIVLPFLGAYIATVVTGDNSMHVAPYVFIASQIIFTAWKALKGSVAAKVAPAPALATDDVAGG